MNEISSKKELKRRKKKIEIETERGKKFLGKYGTTRSTDVAKSRFKNYLAFRNMNCEELIKEIHEDRKGEKINRSYRPEKKVNEFTEWMLEDLGYSTHYVSSAQGTIRAFYKFHDFPLHSAQLKRVEGKTKTKNKAVRLTKKKMAQLYNSTPSKRNKALMLFLYQTGQGREQISKLNFGDVAEELKEGKSPLMIDYGGRKGHANDYCTFLGADGIHALKEYLEERAEKLGLESWKEIDYDAPLFAKRNGEDRLTQGAISEILKYVARNTDVVSDEKMEYADMNPIRPHAFRHNFRTKLKNINAANTEYMMGHDLGIEGVYELNGIEDKEDLREFYAENFEPKLSIQATSREKEAYVSGEFEDLKGEEIRSIVGENHYSKEEVEGIRNGLRKEKENLRKELLEEINEQKEKIEDQREKIEELSEAAGKYDSQRRTFISMLEKIRRELRKEGIVIEFSQEELEKMEKAGIEIEREYVETEDR